MSAESYNVWQCLYEEWYSLKEKEETPCFSVISLGEFEEITPAN